MASACFNTVEWRRLTCFVRVSVSILLVLYTVNLLSALKVTNDILNISPTAKLVILPKYSGRLESVLLCGIGIINFVFNWTMALFWVNVNPAVEIRTMVHAQCGYALWSSLLTMLMSIKHLLSGSAGVMIDFLAILQIVNSIL